MLCTPEVPHFSSSVESHFNQSALAEIKLIRATEAGSESPVESAPLTAVLLAFVCFIAIFGAVVFTVFTFYKDEGKTEKIGGVDSFEAPCQNCRFFNKNQHLRCTVHPSTVMTEQAFSCPDYHPEQG